MLGMQRGNAGSTFLSFGASAATTMELALFGGAGLERWASALESSSAGAGCAAMAADFPCSGH